MSILLLSRPIKNAGDYLFSEKSLEAIKHIKPDTNTNVGHILDTYEIDYLNSFDSIVFAGGPLYDNRFLIKDLFPKLNMLDHLKTKIFFLSAGWYGRDVLLDSIYSYKFDEGVLSMLKFIEENGGFFSCRDDITAVILRNNGLKNVKMVGCTAWYDYNELLCYKPKYSHKINNIIISDQGITKDRDTWNWKYKGLCDLISIIREMFPGAHIEFTFNGGIDTACSGEYNRKVCEFLDTNNIDYFDISGGGDELWKVQ